MYELVMLAMYQLSSDAGTTVLAIIVSGSVTALSTVGTVACFLGGLRKDVSNTIKAVDAIDKKLEAHDATNGQQWERISAHGERLSYVEAKVNGKSMGAGI